MSTSQSSNQPTVNHPGTILANLPAILGFYPRNSVVLACFNDADDSTYTLGPVLRVDVDDAGALSTFNGPDSPLHDADIIFGFVIADVIGDTDKPIVAADIPGLETELQDKLVGIWGCEEISAGQLYRLLFSRLALSPDWEIGEIDTVMTSAAMAPWIASGELPELTRDELMSRFEMANPFISDEDIFELTQQGEDTAFDILADVYDSYGEEALDVVDMFADYLRESEADELTVMNLQADDRFLELAAVICGHVKLRDAAVIDIIKYHEASVRACEAAASSLAGESRAHALSLYALARIAGGLPMLARPALDAAHHSYPEHSLTSLIERLLNVGGAERLIDAVREGSRIAREMISPTADDFDERYCA